MNSPSELPKDFSPIYERHSIVGKVRVRELQKEDYNKGYYELINQLSESPKLSQQEFETQLKAINDETPIHKIIVLEDDTNGKLVGSGTVFLERKFLRAHGLGGHIEDIIVSSEYRKSGYGTIILSVLKEVAFEAGAYKIILDCRELNVPFYEKNGFTKYGTQMKLYEEKLARAPKKV